MLTSLLNMLLALLLGLMSIVVLCNVILRYGFNSGFTWSEEVARFLFVWMVFLGAAGALKDDEHLKVDLLVQKLPQMFRKAISAIVQLIMLYIIWLILEGSWKMTLLNTTNYSPAIGIPMSFIFSAGVMISIGMSLVVMLRLFRIFFTEQESMQVQPVEEEGEGR
jgi:TRAP-type C4-dicarboxylate transport system permease small subunit